MYPNKKRQHHVWRYYLESWANNEQIFCKQPDKIFATNLINIAVENDFYELKRLTDIEKKHLEYFISKIKPELLTLDNFIINSLLSIINLKEKNNINKNTDILMKNFEENINSEIEKNSIRYIDLLRNSNIRFFENETERFEFIIFISAQHFRTKKFKEIYTSLFNNTKYGNSGNLVNIIRLIFTFNFAYNLIEKNYKLQLLINENEYLFLTGDQPVINLVGDGKNPTTETILYYPITPRIAIKLLCSDKYEKDIILIDNEILKYLNRKITENSFFQIFSNDEKSFQYI